MVRAVSIALLLGLLYAVPAAAQQTDPADLAFWQSIQNSNEPAEYQAYLQTFPNGRFASLAQLRAQGRGLPVAGGAPAGQAAMPGGPMPGGPMPGGPMPGGPMPGMTPGDMPGMPSGMPGMPGGMPGMPGGMPAAAGPAIPQDTERPHPNAARFQFSMEQEVINIGEKPVVKVANVPPKAAMSIVIVRAGTKSKGWREHSPDIVARYNFDYYDHDPDPSGPNKYLDTATLEYQPVPVGDYWIRYYTKHLTGADALAGTVAFRVQ